ncbi:hypothetical protein GCK32_015066 [Trichostrongylus colubriformis]|uniref:VWFA domain-containing protein n=1 Tax=Trichostrongylus colubriformis TaxID=6319 RepID=A0AAN8FBL6_TRICO
MTVSTEAPDVADKTYPTMFPPYKGTKSTVIILDSTPSSFRDAWSNQVAFVRNINKHSKLDGMAVVVIDCPSRTAVEWRKYTEEEIGKELMKYEFRGQGTATYQAYGIARVFVQLNYSPETAVIVVSNGKTSDCELPDVWETEFTLSRLWRGYGVRLIYVAVHGTKDFNMKNIKEIIGTTGIIVDVDNINQLEQAAVQRVIPLIPPFTP